MSEQKLNALKLLNVLLMLKKKGKIAFKDRLSTAVLTEQYGTTILYHFE